MSQIETLANSYSTHQPHRNDTLRRRRLEKDDKRQMKFVKVLGATTVAFFAGIGANHLIQQNTAPDSSRQPKVEHASTLPGAAESGLNGGHGGISNPIEAPKP